MKIKVRVKVSVNGLPADFIVRDFSGNIVFFKRFINSFNCFTFCTRSRDLIFTVRPYSADYTEQSKFLRFPCARCVCADLNFNYTTPQPYLQSFTLVDANYLFPIDSAVLFFTKLF